MVRRIVKDNQNDPLLKLIMRLEAGKPWTHIDGKDLVEPEERIYLFNA